MTSKSRRQAIALLGSAAAMPIVPALADEAPAEQPTPYTIDQHMANVSEMLSRYMMETIQKMFGEFNSPENRKLVNGMIDEYGQKLVAVGALEKFYCFCNEENNPPSVIDANDLCVHAFYSCQGEMRSIMASAKRGFVELVKF